MDHRVEGSHFPDVRDTKAQSFRKICHARRIQIAPLPLHNKHQRQDCRPHYRILGQVPINFRFNLRRERCDLVANIDRLRKRLDLCELCAHCSKRIFVPCSSIFVCLFQVLVRSLYQLPSTKNEEQSTKKQYYRSISPNTISSDPMMATTSAIIAPSAIWGRAERFTKLGPRKCTRDGLGPPSDLT